MSDIMHEDEGVDKMCDNAYSNLSGRVRAA